MRAPGFFASNLGEKRCHFVENLTIFIFQVIQLKTVHYKLKSGRIAKKGKFNINICSQFQTC